MVEVFGARVAENPLCADDAASVIGNPSSPEIVPGCWHFSQEREVAQAKKD